MDIIIFVLVLGLIVLIHEFGHFYFARKANILCHEFAIGMGPVIYQKRKGEIVYSIRAIPLGGFVSMAGEDMGIIINKDQRIGLNLDVDNNVTELILHNELQYQVYGRVNEIDLSGEDGKDLYIEMLVSGELIRYNVLRTAKYMLAPKKEMWIAPADRNYDSKTLWQRFLVVFAGPASNFILAFLLLFLLAFGIGKPVNDNIVGKIDNNTFTSHALNKGDEISKVNGKDVTLFSEIVQEIYLNNDNTIVMTVNGQDQVVDLLVVIQGLGVRNIIGNNELVVGEPFGRTKDLKLNDKIKGIYMTDDKEVTDVPYITVNTWKELIDYSFENSELEHVYLMVERDGKEHKTNYANISKKTMEEMGSPYIGYSAGFSQNRKFNILYPFYYPFLEIGMSMKEMFVTLKLLFVPNTGVGFGDLSGPVGIFGMVANARKTGFVSFIKFVAFLSVNIGLLNLLPIPALDGGRLIFIGYEAITKKKVNKKVENSLIMITFMLLFALMIFVTFNDVLRIFK